MKNVILVVLLTAGLALAGDPELREIEAEPCEVLAASDLERRADEINRVEKQLEEARKKFQADFRAFVGDVRRHHGLGETQLLSIEHLTSKRVLLVGPAPVTSVAPVSTASK